jgi:1-acyl-sn-glycerol-3-phosphate acyltransferase
MPIAVAPAPHDTGKAPTPELRGGHVRAAGRIAFVAAWTAVGLAVWGVGNLITLPVPRARLRWRQRVVRRWAVGMSWLLGMRSRVIGTPPRAPFFLATNHLSYMDILLLYTCSDGVFIAKREMRSWPVLGPLANLFGTIWVNRELRRDAMRVLDQIDEAVSRGDGVFLFAEGTTTRGDAMLPMKPALFDWAAREQFPVHYAAITYRTAPDSMPADLSVCWWGEMTFGRHVWDLCRLRGFEATVMFGEAPVLGPTRGAIAEQVQRAIESRYFREPA